MKTTDPAKLPTAMLLKCGCRFVALMVLLFTAYVWRLHASLGDVVVLTLLSTGWWMLPSIRDHIVSRS